ncbi:TPA: hypothetical protein N3N85_005401, partial [Klebsiella pneumoniae]|nr:hypothetical protein [Klebsiella pneumoniae]
AKGKTKLSDLKAIVVKDPEPISSESLSGHNSSKTPEDIQSQKSISLSKKVIDIIRNSMSDTEQLNDIALSQMISAELLIKFKKPRKMTDDEYERVLGAYLKPVSDLDNVSFKRKDNKTEIK